MTGKPARVLHLIGPLAWGGAEHQLCELVLHSDRSHFEPIVCILSDDLGPRAAQLQRDTIRIERLPVGIRRPKRSMALVRELVDKIRPRIVHAHSANNASWGRVIANKADAPLVFTEGGFNSARPIEHRLFETWRTRGSTVVVVNTDALRREVIARTRVAPKKVRVIASAIDISRFDPAADGRPIRARLGIGANEIVFGTVARLHPVKGHRFLLEAAKIVTDMSSDVRFLFIRHRTPATRSTENELTAQRDELGLQEHVTFVEPDGPLAQWLAAVDVFVLPSVSESMPISIIEAMAMAKPVVATEVGGVPEVVENGRSGYVVPTRDPQGLADALLALRDDSRARLEMGGRGRDLAQTKHRSEVMVGAIEAIYDEVMSFRHSM